MVAARAASQDEYILSSEGHLFSAIYRHPGEKNNLTLPPMKLIPLGSRVRVTGICLPSYGSDPFQRPSRMTSCCVTLMMLPSSSGLPCSTRAISFWPSVRS